MIYIRKKPTDKRPLTNARSMRHESAAAETKLWTQLRDRKLDGWKFRRQQPIAPFIADFYCAELKLIVEIDGDSHGQREEYDASRTRHLERDGCHVIRFVNDDVFRHTDAVLAEILSQCQRLSPRWPSP